MILLEGVRNLLLPCTAALVVPCLLVVLAGRGRSSVLAGATTGAAGTVWATAAYGGPGVGVSTRWTITVMVLVGAWLALRGPRAPQRRSPDGLGRFASVIPRLGPALGGVLVAAAMTLLWRPCVGPRLGVALSAAPGDPAGTLVPLLAWTVGALVPLPLAAVLARGAGARSGWTDRAARGQLVAAAVLAGIGLAVGVGVWDDVVSALVRASLR